VVNEAPMITEPANRRVVKPSVHGPLHAKATGEGPEVALRFLNREPLRVPTGETALLDLTLAPGSQGFTGWVYAEWCSPVFVDVCGGLADAGPDIVVREQLRGAVDAVSDLRISPNGDGRQDSTTVSLTLDPDVSQTVHWAIVSNSGSVSVGPNLATGSAFDRVGEVVVDPSDERGGSLISGSYTLRIQLTRDVDGHHFARDLDVPIVVDNTPPTVRRVTADRIEIHPRRGGLPGEVRFAASPRDSWRKTTAQVLDAHGRVVRNLERIRLVDGHLRRAWWDGRGDGGRLVPQGGYRIRLVVEDQTGNRARELTSRVRVDLSRR
jgi:hypothetical protein